MFMHVIKVVFTHVFAFKLATNSHNKLGNFFFYLVSNVCKQADVCKPYGVDKL